ncbi:hypothetical protein BSKO_06321 [Bryopsis sp. KO-2023]|nr:hypothetical protein BSKO_06321 [Bryopsis sp. KO-2023]
MIFNSPYATTVYDVYVTMLDAVISVAVAFSVLIAVDRLFHVVKFVQLKMKMKITGRRPENAFKYQAMPDPMQFSNLYPKVAVQLPMFNERAVCQSIIDHACAMHWPRDKFIVQVLDDSTDKMTRELVDDKVLEWRERGVNVVCVRRTNRQGYKAGALKEGLELLRDYEYIPVFDADFKPKTEFLLNMIPYIHCNDDVGYVQARWVFTNPEESFLTKVQEISLNYHMKCEQWVHFSGGGFFNFNGTAGVWRRKTIEDVGGWNGRTTVEDMDLSLRTYVGGWRAIFVEDETVPNELPSSYYAFRKQQHRWTCGPVQLWRRASTAIWGSKIPWYRKVELNLCYFFLRKTTSHFVALGFFCFLVPLSVFTPEVSIPLWALVHLPVAVTLSTAFFTRKGWFFCVLHVLFENGMSIVKLWAVLNGLLDLGRAQEWVVTQKAGSSDSRPSSTLAALRSCRAYFFECLVGLFILAAAVYSVGWVHRWSFAVFLMCQGLVFVAFGFGLIDSGALLGRPIKTYSLFRKRGSEKGEPLLAHATSGPPGL